MKYTVNIRARADVTTNPIEVIDQVVQRLRRLGPPWGLKPSQELPAPRGGSAGDPLVTLKLSRHISEPASCELTVRNRNWIGARREIDHPNCDDFITIDFDPTKVAYEQFVRVGFPAYVEAIGAYFACVAEERLELGEFDQWQQSPNKGRQGVFRIWSANYWDAELCRRGFALTPAEVVNRLQTHVESASVFNGGALIAVSSKILPKEEIEMIDGRLRPLLLVS